MQSIKTFFIYFFILGISLRPSFAQNEVLELDASPDDIYNDLGFKKAIQMYEYQTDMTVEDMTHIANGYRLNSDTENAELWYSQVVEKSSKPIDFLYYAQALQSNGRYELAKENYLKYDELIGGESADERGRLLAAAIDRIKDFNHSEVKIINEELINTDKLDFSPTFYKNGVIFVSTRATAGGDNSIKDNWIDDNFMSLFYAERGENGRLINAQEFATTLTSRFHEGPVCFSKNGERIFFTRNTYDKEKNKRKDARDGTMRLNIYTSFKDGDKWSRPIELPFNTVEHEEAHPALSPDSKKLYFASNRPGGFGGMDIYVSIFSNGKWGTPKNMGEKINTKGNEIFPFMHDDGTLYFASNGWGGLGGLDIFSATKNAEEEWSESVNLGTPFNSGKDDFAYILNVTKTEGYLTSARKNGVGQDDIYGFQMPKTPLPLRVEVCAFNSENKDRIEDVQVEIIEEAKDENSRASIEDDMTMMLEKTSGDNEYILKLKQKNNISKEFDNTRIFNTDAKGIFEAYMRSDKIYKMIATRDGYQIAEETLDGAALEGLSRYEFCIPLKKVNCMSVEGVVKNQKYGNTVPAATVTMINLCTGEEVVVETDAAGNFNLPCVSCGCDYIFKGEKKNLGIGESQANTIGDNCKLGDKISTTLILGAAAPMKAGTVIELENIYYDFNKSYIREDAKNELNDIARLLKTYPSMVIELSSHTDCRASHKYNDQLSQRRAEAAVNYIASRGIEKSRMLPMGYGERQLKNECADGVNCSEIEHQRNRRTEIKVLRFEQEKDIQVKHIDNLPETIDPKQ